MSQKISPWDVLTTSGKYPEREKDPECTSQVRINAAEVAEAVSKLLDDLGMDRSLSSGFRTVAANKAAGGAPHSNHLTGCAVDVYDPNDRVDDAIDKNPHLLEKHKLYREHPSKTKGWCHLQTVIPPSGSHTFNP